jgi:hypothetical protein
MGLIVALGLPSTSTRFKKVKTNIIFLQNQAQNFERMASIMEMDSKQCLALVHAQMHISVNMANKI